MTVLELETTVSPKNITAALLNKIVFIYNKKWNVSMQIKFTWLLIPIDSLRMTVFNTLIAEM